MTAFAQDDQTGKGPMFLPPPPPQVSTANLTPPPPEIAQHRVWIFERWLGSLKTGEKTVEGVREDAVVLDAGRLVPLSSADMSFLANCIRRGSYVANPRTLSADFDCDSFTTREVVAVAEFNGEEISAVAVFPRASASQNTGAK
jgi:hypothetical protein